MARRRYVLDTNVYIDALRQEAARDALNAFHATHAPFLYLSAVVAQELRAGASGGAGSRVESLLLEPFERRNRLVTPAYAAWKDAGQVLSELVGPKDWASVTRSFVNDVLLAMSCREAGVVLVTNDESDFRRIAAARTFDFVAPWPGFNSASS